MTVYERLRAKLQREPSKAELRAEIERIREEALVCAAEAGKLPHQRGRRPGIMGKSLILAAALLLIAPAAFAQCITGVPGAAQCLQNQEWSFRFQQQLEAERQQQQQQQMLLEMQRQRLLLEQQLLQQR